jgi:hypothetical protein
MRTNKRFSNTTFTKRLDHLDTQHQPDKPSVLQSLRRKLYKSSLDSKKTAAKANWQSLGAANSSHQVSGLCAKG